MSYIKGYSFLKRTCVLLSPLFLLTLASKELAFYAPVSTLSPPLGNLDFLDTVNSIRKLESEINSDALPDDIKAYGDLIIQKTSGQEIWIEQQNPLSGLKYGQDFKFEKLEEGITEPKKIKISKQDNENKYSIDKASFEASEIKEKGGLNLLTVFDLTLHSSYSTVPITHVAPLSDLINASEKHYSVVKVENKDDWWGLSNEEEHSITLKKDDTQQSFSIELTKTPLIRPSSSYIGGDLSSLVIRSFYILYNDEPPLDPQRYFTNQEADTSIAGDTLVNSRAKKVFLNRWSNKSKQNPSSGSPKEPQYEFKTEGDFWKSTCSDPYKVGGFIDEELKDKPKTQEPKKLEKQEEKGSRALERQKNAYVDFRANVKTKQPHNNQYYWKDLNQYGQWVPSDDNGEKWNQPCQDLDKDTEIKLKEYVESNKPLIKELIENREIKRFIIPEPIKQKVDTQFKLVSSLSSSHKKFSHHKVIQSSFRAWGNTYNTNELKGRQIKEAGIYSSTFERAVKTEHKFEISIDKSTWTRELINNSKLTTSISNKDPKQNPDISSVIQVHYPLSFSFYDPISNYLRKNKLLLKTELDLRHLYLQSSFSKEVFRFDIGDENRVIGKDYQGFDPNIYLNKGKDYGLDGTLALIAGLELDIEKNLKITLTAQTNGFVNTKNPSCDLRHRLYKIDTSYSGSKNLRQDLKCSDETSWEYRDYIHIPSFLVLSLTGEPEVSSFYVDNNSGVDSTDLSSKQDEISTLEKFELGLENKEIIKVVETTESNNGEIYFKDMASYNIREDELGEKLHLSQGSWFKNYYQYIYYYTPRRQENIIELDDSNNLKSLKLHIGGSKNSYSSFFHSGHFNTIKTLCINNKHTTTTTTINQECADGIKYDTIEKDKKHSELNKYTGSQIVEINWTDIKGKNSSNPLKVNFRTVLNRAVSEPDSNKFDDVKEKLENLFKNPSQDPESAKAAMFSLLAVWYSVELWCENNKLHYVTKLRPISMVSEEISNASAHKTAGSSGSAGFEISKLEFNYSKTPSK